MCCNFGILKLEAVKLSSGRLLASLNNVFLVLHDYISYLKICITYGRP